MIRVGIVGAGFGVRVILPAFQTDKRCQVAAICTRTRAHAEETAKRHGIKRVYEDWRALVADPEIDVLAIAVPADIQPEIAVAAFGQKKAVFCEKPLAATLKDAKKMALAAQKARTTHAVDFEFPEIVAFQQAKQILAQKKLGRIRHVLLSWQMETYVNRHHIRSWKNEAQKGGGALQSFMSHSFYYLEWLLGPIQALNARLRGADGIEGSADSLCLMRIKFDVGFYANATVSTHAIGGTGHRIEIYGENGSLFLENAANDSIDLFRLSLVLKNDKKPKNISLKIPRKPKNVDGRIGAVSALVKRFLDGCETGSKIHPNLEDGFRVQELIEAAKKSDKLGGRAVFCPRKNT